MCLSIYLEKIYLKELVHTIMETGKSKICRMSQDAGDKGRAEVVVQGLRPSASGIPSCSVKVSLLFYSGLQTIGRVTRIMEGYLLYSKLIYLNVNLLQKKQTFTEIFRIMFD